MFNVGGVLFIRTETAPIRGEHMGFPNSLVGKESTAMQETLVWFLGWEDPLEKG